MPIPIVLASSSPYRRQLLERLGVPFEAVAPKVDETPLAGETARQMALRLAQQKADAVAMRFPQAIVIGSDQVAEMDGRKLGKPGGHEAALQQLLAMQGRTVVFHTALSVLRYVGQRVSADCVDTWVHFRTLPVEALEQYLLRDRPYDCAGSAKIEALGICLVESVRSDDPTALIGLPLIRLTTMLADCGVALPADF